MGSGRRGDLHRNSRTGSAKLRHARHASVSCPSLDTWWHCAANDSRMVDHEGGRSDEGGAVDQFDQEIDLDGATRLRDADSALGIRVRAGL